MDQNMSTPQPNPLLNGTRIPGETFQLPSGGMFYTDGELDQSVIDGEVHVYPMTAYDEILIKTPDLLFSGKAIQQIFERCIPQVQKPLRLLSRDLDFLLICLRSVSFGPEVTVLHTHDCEDAKEHQYSVSIEDFIRKVKRLDSTIISKEYVINLPDGKQVHISPMRYESIVEMMTNINPDKDLSPEELHESSSKQLASFISKVTIPEPHQEVHNQDHVVEWVKSLELPNVKRISNCINSLSDWGADAKFENTCKDCNKKMVIEVPLNPINFFT